MTAAPRSIVIADARAVDDWLEALEDAIGTATGVTLPRRLRAAASALRGQRPGRREIDDTLALQEMTWLLESGEAATIPAAARAVARRLVGQQSLYAASRRLERKFRARHK